MSEVTIGGNRLGSGNKNKAYLRNYERSTHDLSYVWRSTMSAGTLVPFLSEVALPGDTFDIELNCDILTHPTIGPLFGSYKVQLDVFQIPFRLYQGQLHMNMLGIGMDMSKVVLPKIQLWGAGVSLNRPLDNQQINPSCLLSYLNIRGTGINSADPTAEVIRYFNAVPYLGYWDIYKNYYANKQEEKGAAIHFDTEAVINPSLTGASVRNKDKVFSIPVTAPTLGTFVEVVFNEGSILEIGGTNLGTFPNYQDYYFNLVFFNGDTPYTEAVRVTDFFTQFTIQNSIFGANPSPMAKSQSWKISHISFSASGAIPDDVKPTIVTFDLANIDTMRQNLLSHVTEGAYVIDNTSLPPYNFPLVKNSTSKKYAAQFPQEGLALKTYQSDLFNNWISTEWIDGEDGISAVTAIDTSSGSFTIDELNLSKKIYDMLNRIALSGGSYDDWLDAVYTHERTRSAESPIYLGGLIKNLVFQEVVSNAGSTEQPLGTLAGRGRMGNKHKGGKVIAKVDEPSYLMGIISLTPHVDYSQGNKWDVNLTTMNDLHKPALDEIGFQDLITDQMAWFDTSYTGGKIVFKSAGKQPAWINYMTNVNQVRGNFADQFQQMYMTLNRRYESINQGGVKIKDLTTYIDPTKFNHIFADTRLDAQNFWAQVGVNMTARRKMSAKVIPNL